MKKIITAVLSVSLVLSTLAATAQDEKEKEKYEFVKDKSISKTYPASGNKLKIDNSFGHVKFIAWDKNEIKVDVKIEASSNQENVAARIFEAITVTDKQQGNEISFKTRIDNKNEKGDCKNCKTSMSINYEVHLPVTVPLNVENSFGDIELPDYTGALDISSKFGKLTAGALANVKDIDVEFGSASIKKISNIDANFKFSHIEIDNLSGKNNIRLEFCDAAKISLDNSLQELDLHESYSTVNIRPGNLSASYSIATSFGSVVDRTGSGIKRTDTPDRYGPDSDRKYEGKTGNGTAKIEIRSSFGRIIVGEPTAEDIKESKDKSKNKNKSGANRVVI